MYWHQEYDSDSDELTWCCNGRASVMSKTPLTFEYCCRFYIPFYFEFTIFTKRLFYVNATLPNWNIGTFFQFVQRRNDENRTKVRRTKTAASDSIDQTKESPP